MNKTSFKKLNPYLNHESYHVFFSNLSSPLKIGIVLSLRKKSKNVTELSKEMLIEQSKLSHALSSLKKCKIVNAEKKGKQRIYSLNKKTIVPILDLIDKHASIHCKCSCCANNKCGRRE